MKRSNVKPVSDASLSRTSSSLLRRAQADESDAWTQLVETYSRRIYRWCRRAGLQPADASNVVQDVLRAVARKLPDFQHGGANDTFRGWLRRITQNKLKDFFRYRNRHSDQPEGGTAAHQQLMALHDPLQDEGSAAAQVISADLKQLIQGVRSEVSDRDWRFFWRVVVDGQSAVEVAEEFGVTDNTVRIVKMRVLRKLRERSNNP